MLNASFIAKIRQYLLSLEARLEAYNPPSPDTLVDISNQVLSIERLALDNRLNPVYFPPSRQLCASTGPVLANGLAIITIYYIIGYYVIAHVVCSIKGGAPSNKQVD